MPLPPSLLRTARLPAVALACAAVLCAPGARAQATAPVGQSPTEPTANSPQAGQPLPDAAKLPNYENGHPLKATAPAGDPNAGTENLRAWQGLHVTGIEFRGVSGTRLEPLQKELALQVGMPLDSAALRSSLRRLYATGLYQNIDVAGVRTENDVTIIFDGTPQLFIGRVNVNGVSDETLTSLLAGSAKLSVGTPYTQAKLDRGRTLMEDLLRNDGYYTAQVIEGYKVDTVNQQMDVSYTVTVGRRARIGGLAVNGDSGLTQAKFRKISKLKLNAKVTRDTVNTALDKLRANYQKQQLLEAKIKLENKEYLQPVNKVDYTFSVLPGNKVVVVVKGLKISKGSIKNLVPVYEEGTVDADLLNEGDRRIRDLYQRKGYFDIQVSHMVATEPNGQTLITYNVDLGKVHDVDSVTISGNTYFQTSLFEPRLNVHPSSLFEPRGIYSQALVTSDVDTIKALYEGSGFSNVKVDPVVKDADTDKQGRPSKIAHIAVNYVITQNTQQRFGSYNLAGNQKVPDSVLLPLLNTQVGQPYSSTNLTGDRDAVLTYYLSHGYDQATATLVQAPDPKNPNLIDATLKITEGEQIHINQVLISGLHYTRKTTVEPHILAHPGDVLNQTALFDTQRQLYDLTLFNGVNTAIQNPNGDELRKNVLLQFTEAKRWDVTYGFGFQVQTGTPQSRNVIQNLQQALPANAGANGSFGASGLVTVNISRINLRGTDNSLSLRTTYGSLEKIALLTFTDPHPFGKRNFSLSVDGGYTNERDVTTYAASRLVANFRLSQQVGKPTTWIYQYQFRRINVDANTLQVSPDQIPLQSQPVTVGGPGVTWLRDTRRPSPLDAAGGTFNTAQEFFSDGVFGSQSNFNRANFVNSTYYPFGNVHKYVFARQTRIGFERSFGTGIQELVPLPERLYAGGAQSHRGFGINAAGPRDNVTGFPIGGAAVFVNNTELRLPPPTLPVVGNSVSFVIFEDAGNAFVRGRDIWSSFFRIHQPNQAGCRDLSLPDQQAPPTEPNSIGLTGRCSYNYFSHAIGLGARYGTPIGPIRIDASYNLNPPIYPQISGFDINNLTAPSRVGQAPHFNFFFSIGQAF